MPLPQLEEQLSRAVQDRRARRRVLRRRWARSAASRAAVRDRISVDTWRILNQLQQDYPPPARPHPVRRRARAPEPDDHGPRRVQRDGDGEHDARPRLAVSRHRPAARAVAGHDAADAQRARRQPVAHRDARAAARDRRQLDDLPPALLRRGAAAAGARPAARRRDQPARAGVSARPRWPVCSPTCRAIRRRPHRRAKSR